MPLQSVELCVTRPYACPVCKLAFAKWSACRFHVASSERCKQAVDGFSCAEGLQALCKQITIQAAAASVDVSPDGYASTLETPTAPVEPGPSRVAILFGGQGGQYAGMLKNARHIPAVRDMLETSKALLKYDILDIIDGCPKTLAETKYCQPAVFIAGLASLETLRMNSMDSVSRAVVMAGLSLGEYTALCAAGVVSFEDGLKLVKVRAEAMQEAVAVCGQLTLMVNELDQAKLEELCTQATAFEGHASVCSIACTLHARSFTVGGTNTAISWLKQLAIKNRAKRIGVIPTLRGAFHTSLMEPAREKLSQALDELLPRMKTPSCTLLLNASEEPLRPGSNPQQIVECLKRSLTNPSQWSQTMRAIEESEGVTECYDCSPSSHITRLAKRNCRNLWKNTWHVAV